MTRRGLVTRPIWEHTDDDKDRLVVAPAGGGCVVVEALGPRPWGGVSVVLGPREVATLAEALASYRGGVQ